MTKEVAIIIPTYNSARTIVKLLTDITKRHDDAQVYVIDDNSPDGTAQIVKKNFSTNTIIHLLIRAKKSGRGSAVLYGFKTALRDKSLKYFIEMDSDLCHNPKYITEFIKTMKEKQCDVVVASRYLKSSKIKKWSLKRKVLSRVANSIIQLLLGLPLTDVTNGYRCYSRQALTSIDYNRVKSRGFIVLSEFAYYLKQSGNLFCEIPIYFNDDGLAKSNLSFKEIANAVTIILRLRVLK